MKNLPAEVQKLGIKVFNDILAKTKDEEKARQAAWGAIKNVYKKNKKGKWVKKEEMSMKIKQFIEELIKDAKQVWKRKDSMDSKRDILYRALQSSGTFDYDHMSIVEIFSDVMILNNWKTRQYTAVEYSIKAGEGSFGESQEVDVAYIPKEVQEQVAKQVKQLIENKNDTKNLKDIIDVKYAPWILEKKDGKKYLKGPFMESEIKNDNERIYHDETLNKIVEKINESKATGFDGHPTPIDPKSPGDTAMIFEEASNEGNTGFCRFRLLETTAGRNLQVVAEEGISIGLSLRGRGEEKWDKKQGAYIVDDKTYIFGGIDAVTEPAFAKAQAIMEERKKKQLQDQEGGSDMDEKLQKQIAELVASIGKLTTKVEQLETKEASLNEKDRKLLNEAKAQIDKEKTILEAKTKIAEIMESDELKEFRFKDTLRKHLEKCESVEEVEKQYPRTLETLKALTGELKEPAPVHVQIDEEKGLFGAKKYPNSVREAYQYLLEPFKDTGIWEGGDAYGFLDNPKRHAKVMLDNYLKYHMAGASKRSFDLMLSMEDNEVLRESRANPLYHLTKKGIKEALGDTEVYTGDVAATAAAMLPIYWFLMQDVMGIFNQIGAIQTLNVPTGKIFFGKEYYGDGAGGWTEINPTNFDRTKGEKAEGAAPQYLKIQIKSNDISLETALKFIAPWTEELKQDLLAYHRINIDSINIQMARNEVMRALSHKLLYALLTATSYANADNCVQATGSPLSHTLLAPEGYSQAEWERVGLTKTVNQGSALIRKSIWGVKGDNIIVDSDYEPLFQERHFTADNALVTGFGFDRIGTYNNVYKVWTTNIAEYDKVAVTLHRGKAFFEAPFIFMPYILFYIGDIINQTTLKSSRSFMSRFAFGKVIGKKIVKTNFLD